MAIWFCIVVGVATSVWYVLMRVAGGYGLLVAGVIVALVAVFVWRRNLQLRHVLSELNETIEKMAGGNLNVALPSSGEAAGQQVCTALETLRRETKQQMDKLVRATNREQRKNKILARLAHGGHLHELLDEVVRFTEQEDPSIRGSILLYDSARQMLFPGAAPHLPDDYNVLMKEGLPVGPDVGSCGTAAFTRELTVAADIQSDPRWIPYTAFIEKTREHNLKACWSMPILSASGEVLGAFANYCDHSGEPTPENLETLTWAADMAALAIEKKQSEEERSSVQIMLETALSQSPSGICIADAPDVTIRWANPAALEIRGTSDLPLTGVAVEQHTLHWQTFKADGRPYPAEKLPLSRAILNGETTRGEELVIRRASGEDRWVSVNAAPIRDGSGQIVAGIVIFSDITERKQAEEHLQLSEQRFKSILQSVSTVAVQGYAMDGTVRYWNRASEALYGYSAEEAIGRNLLDLIIPPAARDAVREEICQMGTTGKPIPASELEMMHKNGSLIPVYSSHTFVEGAGLEPEFFCIDVDLRNQKRVEAEREQLQSQFAQAQKLESVGRLAGGVAHDFNNLLMVILGEAELALEGVRDNEPLSNQLQEIRTAAKRSAVLTHQLLAFARKTTMVPKILDLNAAIEGMLKMLCRLIGEDIDVAWRPVDDISPVWMDPSQVDQILANLCVNARDAITGPGKITIETRNITVDEHFRSQHDAFIPGDYVLLTVSDNGCGMDAETLEHLFEPFFTTKAPGQGTGLGLATVYGIVKQSEGHIDVYSEPGVGTTLKIYLPQHKAKVPIQPKPEATSIAMTGGETILLVEDEPGILNTTKRMLQDMKYTVISAATPGEAIRLARAHSGSIDLLITDVVMPEMNGRDLARNLLSFYPNIKRLFMSGYTADVIVNHGVLAEGIFFIQKPFSKDDLAAKVREVLDQK